MIIYILIFIFGLCIGSFLNAVIFRLEKEESIIWNNKKKKNLKDIHSPPSSEGRWRGVLARSHCQHCRTTLKWCDLIPVLSFVFLRGKCRYCNKIISLQYPLVEIITGVLFMMLFGKISNYQFLISNQIQNPNDQIFNLISLIYWFYIASSLIVIFVYDLKHYIIPDKILFPTIIISFSYRIFENLNFGFISNSALRGIAFGDSEFRISNFETLLYLFLSALLASGFFMALVLLSRGRWMGLGDIKLAFLMGLILGWPNILLALFLAFMGGALVGLGLICGSLLTRVSSGRQNLFFGPVRLAEAGGGTRVEKLKFRLGYTYRSPSNNIKIMAKWSGYTLKSQIPFGPFLITGTFLAIFWGEKIINRYLGLLF
ncbi:prepilin peptidase [Candidatus Falkowbacteria bacterium]|nr:prepilin peptidase [Candidatus Falkowbacteria bacterium]